MIAWNSLASSTPAQTDMVSSVLGPPAAAVVAPAAAVVAPAAAVVEEALVVEAEVAAAPLVGAAVLSPQATTIKLTISIIGRKTCHFLGKGMIVSSFASRRPLRRR